ncbi:methyltransferase domain-containing protein [Methylobacterium sp. C25]|uniref:methyltransferase domain-containing protein n=1 Tax=Methylobacterium sp. C25 TaxID=2721622 RepID=UPI001F457DE5|nr:methyltransferase domain-containing protein [Methylobacterium sp. C25]MCE4222567.1 methyltransferase domain-containing protein [Methylobacterium sp. C25]
MTAWKQAVARAFDRADEYDGAARIQAMVADGLAVAIAAEPLAPSPHVLEIGCGTGFLTQALRSRVSVGPMLASDIAAAMIARCRTRIGEVPDLHFAVMDAERPAATAGFDLIASSLAAQWFAHLPGALAGLAALLRPGGLLAVTTLAAGTFREWDAAQDKAGRVSATPAYPTIETLRSMRFENCRTEIRLEDVRETHADGAAFLRALRAIGADTPAELAAPRSAGQLRRALRAFDAQGASVTYAVATCLIRRAGEPKSARQP